MRKHGLVVAVSVGALVGIEGDSLAPLLLRTDA